MLLNVSTFFRIRQFEIFVERRGIFEDTDLATLAHLKDTALLRGTYIINEYFTK